MATTSLSNGSEVNGLDRTAVLRLLRDWLSDQLRTLRPGQVLAEFPADSPLEAAPFFLDSLDLLALAGTAADQFGVRESGVEDYFLAKRTLQDWADLILVGWSRSTKPVIVFRSSGSTGDRRESRHFLELLSQEVGVFSGLFPQARRVLKSVPSHHIYGFLFTVILPSLRNLPVVEVAPEDPLWEPGDLLVTHPVHLRLWRARGLVLPRGTTVVTSTSALDQASWDWLASGDCRVFEIFGSSETAGIGWRTSSEEPFRLLPYWSWGGPPDQTLHRPGLDAPLPVPDRLELFPDGRFLPAGRRDEGVKIGGKLVHLEAVRRVLEAHPAVAACAVKTEETDLGLRIKAFVVPRDPHLDWETILREHAAAHLDAPSRPYRYLGGPAIPEKTPGTPGW